MSKARDLASAAPAPAGVTSTELGYVDGVTSAIQTQINSKIGQSTAINPTIVDAKGDLIAATAADTVSRLAVGANDTILVADSTTATGLKWAAPAAGGGMTLLSTTTLTGSSVTLSSIPSTYKHLQVIFYGIYGNTNEDNILLQLNADSANHNVVGIEWRGGSVATISSGNSSQFVLGRIGTVTTANYLKRGVFEMFDYTSTNNRVARYEISGRVTGGDPQWVSATGYYSGSSAVSSIKVSCELGTFSAGTVLLYGVS